MRKLFVPAGIFLLLMAAYHWTMTPGNFWLDSAAFATCNEILGLPHSPSFPVYTVLGRTLHSLLPINPVRASNLYSALAAALAGVMCYYALKRLLGGNEKSPLMARIFAASGAVYACLLIPVWQSAVRAEIYALQILLIMIILYLFIRAWDDPPEKRRIAHILAMVFVQGLAFANHSLMALATLPVIVLTLWRFGRVMTRKDFAAAVVAGIVVFAVALSSYLYLPIRANQNPAINSGRPTTLSSAVQAITRTGEGYLPVSERDRPNYADRAMHFGKFAFEQAGGLVLIGIVAAFCLGIRKRLWVLIGLALSAAAGSAITVWSADFRQINFDIVAYSAVPLILLTMCGFYGLYRLFERFKDRRRIDYVAYTVCGLLIFFQFSGNLYSGDLSRVDGPDKLAAIILNGAPDDAVLLINEDNVLLPLWYHHHALGKRPDLAVISTGGLYRPSYRKEVRRLYPDLALPAEFDSYRIDDLGKALRAFCRLNHDRPLMVQFGTPGIETDRLSPADFLFRYSDEPVSPDPHDAEKLMAILDTVAAGATDPVTKEFTARTAFNYGVYFDRFGDQEAAYTFFKYAIETDDTNPDYFLKLGMAFLKAGKVRQAVMLLEEATNIGNGCPQADELLRQIRQKEFGKR